MEVEAKVSLGSHPFPLYVGCIHVLFMGDFSLKILYSAFLERLLFFVFVFPNSIFN